MKVNVPRYFHLKIKCFRTCSKIVDIFNRVVKVGLSLKVNQIFELESNGIELRSLFSFHWLKKRFQECPILRFKLWSHKLLNDLKIDISLPGSSSIWSDLESLLKNSFIDIPTYISICLTHFSCLAWNYSMNYLLRSVTWV